MGTYTWTAFPLSVVTENFEALARAALEEWRGNASDMDDEIEAARGGETDLDTRLDGIEDLSRISDGTITEAKLDINNAPADTKVLQYNASAGKPEWNTAPSAEDTGEVRRNAADPKDYLDAKLEELFLL